MLAGPAEAAARCRNTGSFERWLDGFKQEAAAQGISRAGDLGRARRRDLRSGHHPARQRAGRVHAELPAIRRPHDRRRALSERPEADEGQRRRCSRASSSASACRRAVVTALWGLESDYGAYKGGTYQHHPLGRDAGLRLPAPGVLPQAADGRAAHRAARRPAAGGDDRQLGRRARPDAVHAVGLFQARRRLRRRRPRRHDPQHAGRARLRRQSAEELRLAARPALAAGGARAGADAVAGGRPRRSSTRARNGCAGASPPRTASCRPTTCRRR